MQVTDARGMSAVEIAALMRKTFDECELSPEFRQVLPLCLVRR
ncbi:MAG: hypothetical protein ACLR2G_11130 [Phascolarctobacterium faecium]